MWLEAILSKEDLVSVASELLPLGVQLGPPDSEHYVLLSAATAVTLVEGRGLRIACNAQIRWPVLGMDIPINVEGLTVLVEPSVPEGGGDLHFLVQLEQADVAWVPAFVDAKLVDVVNDALKERAGALSWDFAETLSHRFPLPEMLGPARALSLGVSWGKVRITGEALVLVVSFRALAVRDTTPELVPMAPEIPTRSMTRPSAAPSPIEQASPRTVAIATTLVVTAA